MANVYIVSAGDTLSAIAQKNSMSIGQLLSLNPELRKNPNSIFPGQTISLSASSTGSNENTQLKSQSVGVHIVSKGETLSKIAQKYGTSLSQLLSINPALNNNPNMLLPGQPIRIAGNNATLSKVEAPKIASPTANWIALLTFNGKQVTVISFDNNKKIVATYKARSGLPPNAPHLKELIAKGRTDLKVGTDYSQSRHQNVKDAGPIPADTYTLPLVSGMPFDKSASSGDGAGWGVGGWWLREGTLAWLDNYFGGRSGFFLHHDGGSAGTSGCVGIVSGNDMKRLRQILINAQQAGQKAVKVKVTY